ncbi:hypothetical protein niasHT_020690 [Heterodera trifolii]|uniref:F-box domain-containing protein n=1 Tax=Heterodera trifolii TaxID=157864 RepID=A0ABD2KM12_9BILA
MKMNQFQHLTHRKCSACHARVFLCLCVLWRLLYASKSAINPKSASTTATLPMPMPSSGVQQRMLLPLELIYELLLWVPSTNCRARRLLLNNSLFFHFITGSKNGKNWKRPLPVLNLDEQLFENEGYLGFRALLPRIHSDLARLQPIFTSPLTLAPFMNAFVENAHGGHSLYALLSLDQSLLSPVQTLEKSRLALQRAINREKNSSFSTLIFHPLSAKAFDVVEISLDQRIIKDIEQCEIAVQQMMRRLTDALDNAARGLLNFLL